MRTLLFAGWIISGLHFSGLVTEVAAQRAIRTNPQSVPSTSVPAVSRPKPSQPGNQPNQPGGGHHHPGYGHGRYHYPHWQGHYPPGGFYRPGWRVPRYGWYQPGFRPRWGFPRPYAYPYVYWHPVHSVIFSVYPYQLGVFPPVIYPFAYSGFYGSYTAPGVNFNSAIGANRLRQSILLDSKIVQGPELPPARIRFQNSSVRPLQVAVADLLDARQVQTIRIPPRSHADVTLERNAGATRISQYRTYDEYGYPVVREVVTQIEPPARYEVAVHEWAMQSVAIDRTGKSPNVIEDVNMQGRGMGRFPLPAGDELRSGTIDVLRAALAANNPGAVAPLVPGAAGALPDNASALERAVFDAQQEAFSGNRDLPQ